MFAKLKKLLATCVLAVMALVPMAVSATSLGGQIDELNAKIAHSQAALNDATNKADSLQAKVDTINAQIDELQAKIDKATLEIEQTRQQINDAIDELNKQKAIMFENARTLYKMGNPTTIEILASSDNFSQFIDKQEYLSSVREAINKAAAQIQELKDQLVEKQNKLEEFVQEQKVQRGLLANKRNEQAELLAGAREVQNKYASVLDSQKEAVAALVAAQQAAFNRLKGGNGPLVYRNFSGEVACGGGYDATLCNAPKDTLVDSWALYNRECVSYAAWAMAERFGKHVEPFHGEGNAGDWPSSAPRYSGATADYNPTAGSVAIAPPSMIGGVGHAMVVESVLGDGWIHVSQYNWSVTGLYSEMDVKAAGLIFIHFHS